MREGATVTNGIEIIGRNYNDSPVFQYNLGGVEGYAGSWYDGRNSRWEEPLRNGAGNLRIETYAKATYHIGHVDDLPDFSAIDIWIRHNIPLGQLGLFWGTSPLIPSRAFMRTSYLSGGSGYRTDYMRLTSPPSPTRGDDLFLGIERQYTNGSVVRARIDIDNDALDLFHGDTEPEGDTLYAWDGDPYKSTSYAYRIIEEPELTEVEAPAPTWTDYSEGGGEWTTPEVEGVTYSPASGQAEPGQSVTVTATALDGYEIVGPTEWTHVFPEEPEPEPEPGPGLEWPPLPEPEPEPELPPPPPEQDLPEPEVPDLEPGDNVIEQLAERVAAYIGEPEDEQVKETAKAQLPTVVAFVKGYTRGNGFSEAGVPEHALVHVIVSSAARLVSNPEQFTYFAALDFQVRPTVFNGWTLPELAVLNGYRKRWA